MKALELLKENKSIEERAKIYVKSIKRDLQKEIIDVLVEKKEKLDDELYELKNFVLDTNVNRGLSQMTKEDCKKRFTRIIEIEYEKVLLEAELKVKEELFKKYFDEQA